jgi:hypothetical protein
MIRLVPALLIAMNIVAGLLAAGGGVVVVRAASVIRVHQGILTAADLARMKLRDHSPVLESGDASSPITITMSPERQKAVKWGTAAVAGGVILSSVANVLSLLAG